jgi:hypothetical protein
MRSRPVTPTARREHRRERALAIVASRAAVRSAAAALDELEAVEARPRLVLVPAPLASVTTLGRRSS